MRPLVSFFEILTIKFIQETVVDVTVRFYCTLDTLAVSTVQSL